MSIEKDLVIRYRIDRSQAKEEMSAFEREMLMMMRRVRQDTKNLGDTTEGVGESLKGLIPTITAVGAAATVFASIRDGVKQTSDYVNGLTQDFLRQRDAMRELAGILGQKGDIAFTQQQYDFAAKVGMPVEESTKFREAFQGVAQQYKGKFANEGEFNKYEEQSARYAASMGLSADVAADLSGAMIRTMPQGGTAQDAMLAFGQSFHTMQQGSGSNKVLASQLREVTSSMVGPGMAFRTPQEAAVAVRTMAESNPEEAATMLQRMRDAQIKLDAGEKAEFGVDSTTPLLEMIQKVGEKSKGSKVPLDEYLHKFFPLAIASRGFRVGIQQGLGNNVIQKGLDDVNEIGAGETEAGVDEAFADPTQAMMLRQEEAGARAKAVRLGADKTLIAPYLKRAEGELAGRNADARTGVVQSFVDKTFGWIAPMLGSSLNAKDLVTHQQAAEDLEAPLRKAGVDFNPVTTGELLGPTRALEKHLADLVELNRKLVTLQGGGGAPKAIDGKPNVGFPR